MNGFESNNDEPVFMDQFLFLKRFEFKKFLGIQDLPYTVYKDTRIKPEEERTISFPVDASIDLKKFIVTLRGGFIGDFGEEVEAWTSDILVQKEIEI